MRETMTVFKNGTIIYTKRYNLELRCDFDFSTESRGYEWKYIFYPMTYSQAYLKLSLGNYTTNGELEEVTVRIYDQTEDFSGIRLKITPDKKTNYYTYTIVVPSILFTWMSYLGFWIDSKSVPARAYLGALAILVNINAYFLLPVVSSANWMGNFLLGCLMFGVLTMIGKSKPPKSFQKIEIANLSQNLIVLYRSKSLRPNLILLLIGIKDFIRPLPSFSLFGIWVTMVNLELELLQSLSLA